MRFYRVYGLDRADCVEGIQLISAPNDLEALRQARAETGFHAVEVWDQWRRVGRVGMCEAQTFARPATAGEVLPGSPAA